MARVPDKELTKAFGELQDKKIDTTQKLRLADIQIEELKRSKQHAELTIKEIASLPNTTKTYESVGRMFLLDDIASIEAGLKNRMKNADEKISMLETNKTYLERDLRESQNNLREMIHQKQNKKSSG